jgi:peptidoglycan/LPS O-acetylase OafA/YrhL
MAKATTRKEIAMNILQRNWVTPIAAGAFLLSAVTGVLIFFHVDSGANKFVHEWLSWVLLGGALLHVFANFNGLKAHLSARRGQALVGLFAVVLALSFIPFGGEGGKPPFAAPVRALGQSSVITLAQVARVSPDQLRDRLGKAGVHVTSDQQTLAELIGPDERRQMHVLGEVFQAAE